MCIHISLAVYIYEEKDINADTVKLYTFLDADADTQYIDALTDIYYLTELDKQAQINIQIHSYRQLNADTERGTQT